MEGTRAVLQGGRCIRLPLKLLAAVVVATTAGATLAMANSPEIGAGFEIAANLLAWARQHLEGILAAAYARAPALVMVLAALFIIPVIALLALLAHALRLQWRLLRPISFGPVTARVYHAAEIAADHPRRAQLLIEGRAPAALPTSPTLVRIGRHEDNDIRLAHASVHRHHALIHRTSDDEYVIVDLSGREGNGVLVNGQRIPEARLAAGDEIVLGTVSLRFEQAA